MLRTVLSILFVGAGVAMVMAGVWLIVRGVFEPGAALWFVGALVIGASLPAKELR